VMVSRPAVGCRARHVGRGGGSCLVRFGQAAIPPALL
jgi:hypothetical protein